MIFLGIVAILIIGGIFSYKGLLKKKENLPLERESVMVAKPLIEKRIAIIVAFRDFRDEEYFETKEVLQEAGAEIVTVSDSIGKAIGKFGGEVEVDLSLRDLEVENFDAIVFIGGPGALAHLDNELSYEIAKSAFAQDKVVGAICVSPVILAKAGILKGKKATVWSSITERSTLKILEKSGAHYLPQAVVVDGKIVTANGPSAAKEFGLQIVELLKEK